MSPVRLDGNREAPRDRLGAGWCKKFQLEREDREYAEANPQTERHFHEGRNRTHIDLCAQGDIVGGNAQRRPAVENPEMKLVVSRDKH